jgi:SAM-dependent methyltransferase
MKHPSGVRPYVPKNTVEDTGERMLPELSPPGTFWEHVYRYRFALQFVEGRRVLDIASGEGYGAAALMQAASAVTGVDINPLVCQNATEKYGLTCVVGSAEKIPLSSASVEVVVSFETIEHVARPKEFLDECHRVLVPGGTLVISTPNKALYNNSPGMANPFHCSELTENEFRSFLGARFGDIRLFGQNPRIPLSNAAHGSALLHPLWLTFRGAPRLRKLAQRIFCPHIATVAREYRIDPLRAIFRAFAGVAEIGNPYVVVERQLWPSAEFEYLIAVARKGSA